MQKFRNIKKTLNDALIVLVGCIAVGFCIYFYTAGILNRTMEDSLVEIAKQGAKNVEYELRRHMDILEMTADSELLKNPTISIQNKAKKLYQLFSKYDFSSLTLSDKRGFTYSSKGVQLNIGDRIHFRKAIQGQKYMSEPFISRTDKKLIIVFSVPITNHGEITNVLSAVYYIETLSKMTDKIRLGKKGNSFIVNSKGEFIAHDNRDLVYQRFNPINEVNTTPSLKKLAKLIDKMIHKKVGAGSYIYLGVPKYMGYAPIEGTHWALAVTAPRSIIFKDINQLLMFLLGSLMVVGLIIGILHLYLLIFHKKLRDEHLLATNVIDIANIIIIRYDEYGKILDFNDYAERNTGYIHKEIVGKKRITEIIDKEDYERLLLINHNLHEGELPRDVELTFQGKDGKKIHIIGNFNLFDSPDPEHKQFELIGINITERVTSEQALVESHAQLTSLNEEITASEEEIRSSFEQLLENQKELSKSEERYRLVVEAAGIGIWDWDVINQKWFYSSRWYQIFEVDSREFERQNNKWYENIYADDRDRVMESYHQYINDKTGMLENEYRILLANGQIRWINSSLKGMWDTKGKLLRLAGSHQDITPLKETQEKLEYLAYHDSLTRLPNRLMLQKNWSKWYQTVLPLKSVVFFIDSDNYKLINDTWGHSFGDQLISAIGDRIQLNVSINQRVFRISGDEFVICGSGYQTMAEIKNDARTILKLFEEPFDLNGKRIHLSVSMGIAVYPEHGSDILELLKNADIAMYKAKELGKNRYVLYDLFMQDAIREYVEMEQHLRDAFLNQEFVVYYQPQIKLDTGEVSGFEALLRWNSPTLGIVSPQKFIEVAEESGLIVQLGEWVLRNVCAFLKEIIEQTQADLNISVNVSILQLMQDDFVDKVLDILNEYQLDPENLELEITESILIESFDSISEKLQRLRHHRIHIALDDFGTGYSSLNYLRQLPISTLKIDKSFIDHILINPHHQIFTGDIVTIGRKMGLTVIAEGVEQAEQLDYLKQFQCDKIQGFIFSKPVPAKDILEYIQTANMQRREPK